MYNICRNESSDNTGAQRSNNKQCIARFSKVQNPQKNKIWDLDRPQRQRNREMIASNIGSYRVTDISSWNRKSCDTNLCDLKISKIQIRSLLTAINPIDFLGHFGGWPNLLVNFATLMNHVMMGAAFVSRQHVLESLKCWKSYLTFQFTFRKIVTCGCVCHSAFTRTIQCYLKRVPEDVLRYL